MKVICSSEESLYRPEAVRWRQRMEIMKPLGDTVVLLPCSMKKPYSNSKSHQKFRKLTRSFQELIVTSPFGICPRELENTFPIQSYDVSTTGSWSSDEIEEHMTSALPAHGQATRLKRPEDWWPSIVKERMLLQTSQEGILNHVKHIWMILLTSALMSVRPLQIHFTT